MTDEKPENLKEIKKYTINVLNDLPNIVKDEKEWIRDIHIEDLLRRRIQRLEDGYIEIENQKHWYGEDISQTKIKARISELKSVLGEEEE